MRWFEGDIAQAVAISKAKNAIFVVFIEGTDEASRKVADVVNSDAITMTLENTDRFVSIRVESGTETYNQFTQIYRVAPVPSIFFIGRNGTPLDVVSGEIDIQNLSQRIISAERQHSGSVSLEARMQAQSRAQDQAQPPAGIQPAVGVQLATDEQRAPEVVRADEIHPASDVALTHSSPDPQLPTSTLSHSDDSPSSSSGAITAPIEQRVEKVKELLDQKRAQKQQQEEEEARRKEVQRRKEGQGMQELKRWQEEQEMKQLREERLREKRQEQEARQRVLEQIAQDRANRNARNAAAEAGLKASSAQPQTPSSSPIVQSNSNEARLQFRLPNGSTHANRFLASDTLADVRQYITANVPLPFHDFTLATMFPRQEFTSQDNASTLRDLQLVPTSVVLIIPAGGHSVVRQDSPGIISTMNAALWALISPVVSVLQFVRNLIFGGGGGGSSRGSVNTANAGGSTPTNSQPQQSSTQEKRPVRRSGAGGGAYRRTGTSNVHRLHQNHSSSDDDNNTWNGNSTQQM